MFNHRIWNKDDVVLEIDYENNLLKIDTNYCTTKTNKVIEVCKLDNENTNALARSILMVVHNHKNKQIIHVDNMTIKIKRKQEDNNFFINIKRTKTKCFIFEVTEQELLMFFRSLKDLQRFKLVGCNEAKIYESLFLKDLAQCI